MVRLYGIIAQMMMMGLGYRYRLWRLTHRPNGPGAPFALLPRDIAGCLNENSPSNVPTLLCFGSMISHLRAVNDVLFESI
jgi:hypothetical protein